MKKFKFSLQHNYEVFPSIIEIEAVDQGDALRKIANKIEDNLLIIGEIQSMEIVVKQVK